MNASSRVRSVAVVLFALVALSALAPSAHATHSWRDYHWARTSNAFTIKLGDNVSGDWDTYLRNTSSDPANNDWSDSSVLDTVVVAGQSNKRCGPTNGRVEVCNSNYGRNGWLGLAQIWISGSHITQGVAKMNDTYFSMAAYNNPSEKLHVMCQEVGHTFGLGHTSEDGSSQNTCMDYYYNATDDGISTRPNAHDYEQLEAIYEHLDSSTTISALPADVANAELDTPAQWGREVHAGGRMSIFEREFPGGHKIITHVFWAVERGHAHDH